MDVELSLARQAWLVRRSSGAVIFNVPSATNEPGILPDRGHWIWPSFLLLAIATWITRSFNRTSGSSQRLLWPHRQQKGPQVDRRGPKTWPVCTVRTQFLNISFLLFREKYVGVCYWQFQFLNGLQWWLIRPISVLVRSGKTCGRLGTVDLLIRVECFVKKVNKEVSCTEQSPSVRVPWLSWCDYTSTQLS